MASAVLAVWAAVFGTAFLFAPIHRGCRITISEAIRAVPGGGVVTSSTTTPEVCESFSLAAQQEIWPVPFLWIALWSLAPTLAAIGVWTAPRPRRWLVYTALLLELTVMISFGAAPYFVPLVLLPLGVVAFLAARASSEHRAGSVDAQAGGGG